MKLIVLPGRLLAVLTLNPAGGPVIAVPGVVTSDSEDAIVAASWSTWVCACTRVWSRSFRSAAIWPELRTLADASIKAPFGSLMPNVPTPFWAGLALYREVAVSAPGELNVKDDASPCPTSWMPELVKMLAWFEGSVTTRISTSFDRSLIALSR